MVACRYGTSRSFAKTLDRRFALEELADAFRYEMSGEHFGKIGVEW
jgi:hypothetical protein